MDKYIEILRLWGITGSLPLPDGRTVYSYKDMQIAIDAQGKAYIRVKLPSTLEDSLSKKGFEFKEDNGGYKKCLLSNEMDLANFLLEYDKCKDDLLVDAIIRGDYGQPKTEIPESQIKLFADFNKKYRELYPKMFRAGEEQRYSGDESEFINYCESKKSAYGDNDRAFIKLIINAFEGKKNRTYKENVIRIMNWGTKTKNLSPSSNGELISFPENMAYDDPGFLAGIQACLKDIGAAISPFISADISRITQTNKPYLENVSIETNIETNNSDDNTVSARMKISAINNTSNFIAYDKTKDSTLLAVTNTFGSSKLQVCYFSNENYPDEMLRGIGVIIDYSDGESDDKSFSGRFIYNFNTNKIRTINLNNPSEEQTFSLESVDSDEKERLSTIEAFMSKKIVEASDAVNSILLGHSSKRTM